MNTIWSSYIQSIGTLYTSRALRFADNFEERYKEAFAIADKSKILEIGCGPGALAESLSRWYPDSKIYGVDRDGHFVNFAREKVSGVEFFEGDATNSLSTIVRLTSLYRIRLQNTSNLQNFMANNIGF